MVMPTIGLPSINFFLAVLYILTGPSALRQSFCACASPVIPKHSVAQSTLDETTRFTFMTSPYASGIASGFERPQSIMISSSTEVNWARVARVQSRDSHGAVSAKTAVTRHKESLHDCRGSEPATYPSL